MIPSESAPSPSLIRGRSLSAGGLSLRQIFSLRDQWRAGRTWRVEDVLTQDPTWKDKPDAILDLIYLEVELRRDIGEAPTLGEYVSRFPTLRTPLRDLFAVDEAMAPSNQAVKVADDTHTVLPTSRSPGGTDASQQTSADPVGPLGVRSQSDADVCLPRIAGYEILEELARGGMGVVFKARQTKLNRLVAIKQLLPGYRADRAGAERFRKEAALTAGLQHPGIPPVHELGSLADGAPFLAMKLIAGRTLAQLLRERQDVSLEIPRFLPILEQVAQTVGYAHAQGVIHRDLKPANVMVGAFGEVQVMDWGLAKNLRDSQHDAQERASAPEGPADRTMDGEIMGTIAYMPPEQARGEIRALDARADVFALGAMLFDILVDGRVYEGASIATLLRNAQMGSLEHAHQLLRESDCDRDLAAIATACLSANPVDRPADGTVVARQIADYRATIEGRLRQAESDRAAAEATAREQIKRRRVWFGLALSLLGGTLVAAGLAVWSEYLRREANKATATALKRLAQVENNTIVLGSIFTDLNLDNPENANVSIKVLLAKRLKAAAKKIDQGNLDAPLVTAQLQTTLAQSLSSVDEYETAASLLEASHAVFVAELGENHRDTLLNRALAGVAYVKLGQIDRGLKLMEESLHKARKQYGDSDPLVLGFAMQLAEKYRVNRRVDEAISLYKNMESNYANTEARAYTAFRYNLALCYVDKRDHENACVQLQDALTVSDKEFGIADVATRRFAQLLASEYQAIGRETEAVALLDRYAKDSPIENEEATPRSIADMTTLAMTYKRLGKRVQALEMLRTALGKAQSHFGENHKTALDIRANIGATLREMDDFDGAIDQLKQVLEAEEKSLGPDHVSTLTTMANLAEAYRQADRISESLPYAEKVYEARKRTLGAADESTLRSANNLGEVLRRLRRYDRAAAVFEDALVLSESTFGFDNEGTLMIGLNLSNTYRDRKEFGKEADLLSRVYEATARTLGADHPETRGRGFLLARRLIQVERLDRAKALLESLTAIHIAKLGPADEKTIMVRREWFNVLERMKLLDEALTVAKGAREAVCDAYGDLDSRTTVADTDLGTVLLNLERWEEAEPVWTRLDAWFETNDSDSPYRFHVKSTLGEVLFHRDQPEKAEPLLLAGYDGLKARRAKLSDNHRHQLRQAAQRLLTFYESKSDADKIAHWRAELAQYDP
jgi:tRNA A-37 threonylcarbamoyl transferase component Bud32